jgi:hypothetical protein
MRTTIVLSALVIATGIAAAQDQPHACADETRAEVAALSAMHEVIYPLWHEAWPNKNVAMVKELLPQLREHVAAVAKAELPGILRDKRARWDRGVATLRDTLSRLEAAGYDGAVLAAVETLHADYEALVRVVRPALKELDAYHVVLYQVYHHLLPERRIGEVGAAAAELVSRCQALAGAQLPRRVQSREAQLRAGFAALCDATNTLRSAAASGDAAAVAAAVEEVHTRYQQVERLVE